MTSVNANVIEVNFSNFDREVLEAKQPVLVEFWADWSLPCRDMDPLLKSVSEEDVLSLKVARVNVAHGENLTDRYGVRAVPTFLLFNQGDVRDQIVGRTTRQAVQESLARLR